MNFTQKIFSKNQHDLWLKHLDDEGYVVIKDILTDEEKTNAFNLFTKDIQTVSPNLNFENPESFIIQNVPCMFGKGMAVFNGFGQSDAMWNLRTNNNIQNIFKAIHKTDELVVSLDGFSLFVSSEQKSKPWLHIDQNPSNQMYSIQGAYNLLPVTNESAGFVVIPKSHKLYNPEVSHKKNWIICENQKKIMEKAVKLIIPENCLVLWNSKTIHCNIGMNGKRKSLDRITAFLSYQPKSIRNDEILKKRKEAYFEKKSTSHWVDRCEIKQYPWGFKTNYEKKKFKSINLTLNIDGTIPNERLELL